MCSMEIIQIPHGLFVFYDCIQTAESLLCRSQHYPVEIYLHSDAFLRRSIEEPGYEFSVLLACNLGLYPVVYVRVRE